MTKIIDELNFNRAVYAIMRGSKYCPRGWLVGFLMPYNVIDVVFFSQEDFNNKNYKDYRIVFLAKIDEDGFKGFKQEDVEKVLRKNLENLGYSIGEEIKYPLFDESFEEDPDSW